jgi:Tfp pilus assembly protein PilV
LAVTSRKRLHGFTLAESLTASVILSISVLGVCTAIVAAQRQVDLQEEDTTAIVLARQIIEEAAALPLTASDATAGWPSVTNSANYDTIRDFDGYTDTVTVPIRRTQTLSDAGTFSTAAPSVTAVTGSIPTLTKQQYLRQVSVTLPNTIFGTAISSGDFAVITVTVTSEGGNGTMLSRVVARNTVQR